MQTATFVALLHASTTRLVYEFAGAGVEALSALHAVSGSSRTVLEASDWYSKASLELAVGQKSLQSGAASVEVVTALAWHAYERAVLLSGIEDARVASEDEGPPVKPVLGVACVGAIATDRVRRGADRALVAIASGPTQPLRLRSIHFPPSFRGDRPAQERAVSDLVILATCCEAGVVPADAVLSHMFAEHGELELLQTEQTGFI
ncbi:hypothetical protein FVE85_5401 [Porphyridium purpureum]|uniref:Uncharacterized protein n=1 Tax=Porphyridium purpureum TaxID=35688 RepID=A0A5J4Z2G4_PORPP|nr:hypothetical protein FVE85_5401 [Porphyridium purpureum]|eukprot:POR8196..scf295_1